jgi:hypothetical protein
MQIFLDIDGVMVPAKSWKSPELLDDGFPAFSARAIKTLQRLISNETTIVLTTSHKSFFSIEGWKQIFRNRNINIERIEALPANVENISRKEEITNWFNTHLISEPFVIIDDDRSLNDLPENLKENLIQTSPLIGLTEDHLELINSIPIKSS